MFIIAHMDTIHPKLRKKTNSQLIRSLTSHSIHTSNNLNYFDPRQNKFMARSVLMILKNIPDMYHHHCIVDVL